MDGVVLVDKPAGPTSHDVVSRVRRALPRGVKVGHAGTLDPFATGLLLVLLGRATRIQQWLMELGKEYETVARLGWTSTTGDPEGELLHTGCVPPRDAVLPTGRVTQRPPAYSAIRIDGRRAYALARSGVEVEVPERTVTVTRFDQLWRDDEAGRAAYSIACSSGTYVRSLIADLHDGYCVELRRTAIGLYRVEDAAPPPDRDDPQPWEPSIIPLGTALSQVLPTIRIDDDTARRAGHGQVVEVETDLAAGTAALLLDPDGEPVCVADLRSGHAKPRVGFRARRALGWITLIAIALLAGAWGVLALIHPHAGWLPGLTRKSDVSPVLDVGFLVVPVIVIGVALQRITLELELDWLAWRTRRARRRREP